MTPRNRLNKPNIKPSRKELRKQKRNENKVKRKNYFSGSRKKKQFASTEIKAIAEKLVTKTPDYKERTKKKPVKNASKITDGDKVLSIEELNKRSKRELKKLQKEMASQTKEQLLKANEEEDRTIKRLEKLLKLNKRKTKTIPKSFVEDGLDYLLEICDPEYMSKAAAAEQKLYSGKDKLEEDFALMTGNSIQKSKKKKDLAASPVHESSDKESDSDDLEDFLNEGSDNESDNYSENEDDLLENTFFEENGSDNESIDSDLEQNTKRKGIKEVTQELTKKNSGKKQQNELITDSESEDDNKYKIKRTLNNVKARSSKKKKQKKHAAIEMEESDSIDGEDENLDSSEDLEDIDDENSYFNDSDMPDPENDEGSTVIAIKGKRKVKCTETKGDKSKKRKKNQPSDAEESYIENMDSDFDEDSEEIDENEAEVWEDIYGRLRSKEGAVINKTEGKYIPPAIRAKMEANGTEDHKRKEKLDRIKKQLKGLLNRLAESNMHNIASQIETLYMSNSRNDMNETLTSLIIESLITTVMAPERLLMEHVLLIAILHANVGTEVGAYFLQTISKNFDLLSKSTQQVEDKNLDNLVNILAQLYNFKVFDAKLMYEILQRLTTNFDEKNVECILHILRSVGFGLRKDDPLAMKNLILESQKQAAAACEGKATGTRVKFLLDILLAIRNNNVTKIPNYDTSYSQHLKKVMKGFIRKGNYITTLNISLEDLLKADERGKWWVVGSAWTGNIGKATDKKEKSSSNPHGFSQYLLDLAKKQRMNTETRRTIFCTIFSSEDYLDAFERLLRLGLKSVQEREIINVILHCCIQENPFNPFYAVLLQKFCDYDRKYQMILKCAIWDKLATLKKRTEKQLSNLAKLMTRLVIEKGLPITILKKIEFSEIDEITERLIRQVLIGILLHENLEAVQSVFLYVAVSPKLKTFRVHLRVFIHHFLLKHLKEGSIPEDQSENFRNRAKMVEKILTSKESSFSL